jgi:cation diffusion facilitator CzcD-associated flavoprotein CzcO
MHTANFNPNFDWTGKNVALIGAGSTGIQVLPNIQPRAKRVFHYMKGKTWISPVGYAAEVGGGKNFGASTILVHCVSILMRPQP